MQTSTTVTHDYITMELKIKHGEYYNDAKFIESMYNSFLCGFSKSFRLKLAKLILAKDTQTNEQYY